MRVLLVDDEPLALARLEVGFREIPETTVVGAAGDGRAALEKIAELKPDVVILDIRMPFMDGLEVARALSGENAPEVIFVTAYDQYAPEAFDVEAADYLLKPVRFDRLQIAVDRARKRRAASEAGSTIAELTSLVDTLREKPAAILGPARAYEAELWIPTTTSMMRVPVAAIMWIEAARDYALIHTGTRSFILRETMGALEGRLDPEIVMRVHRSAFVNRSSVAAIRKLGKGLVALTLSNGHVVHVGPSYTKAVVAALGARGPQSQGPQPSMPGPAAPDKDLL